MIKFDPSQFNKLQNRPASASQQDFSERSQNQVSQRNPVSTVTLSGQQVSSFSLFQKTVIKKLEQALPNNRGTSAEQIQQAQSDARERRADVASSNILNFIGARLKLDAQNGATPEQLESRLEAALKGYESGFDEANGILSDMGLMSDDVEADVNLTNSKVRQGLAELTKQYLGDDAELLDKINAEELEESEALNEVVSPTYSQVSAAQGRSFSFELETRDGDKVTINARSLEGFSRSQSAGGAGFAASFEREFALGIEGELDEGELKAINDLLKEVNSLSEDFYSGDMQKALEKALSLGYDSSEIGSFSINLTQVSSVKAVQAYQPEEPLLKPAVLSELRPLGKYASDIAESLVRASELFNQPEKLFSELLENIAKLDEQEGRQSIVEFYSYSETVMQQFATKLLPAKGTSNEASQSTSQTADD
ncbi:DUF5610 domain-containing protein [Psychrosphaera ytuae]|uniref:DUF5610 domain-containing protein n=1 Tax=Psychrosphaera ytuae TaxID=2820710 RepID=A0A975D986_9GAMM|nr:DUF5610 domain-containing protein [Psychrosphaera ytuae]QTH62857.1 DUF5610 domain-containing protein [Psychrosphaera ytuae]